MAQKAKIIACFAMSVLAGCARPNYVRSDDKGAPSTQGNKTETSCDANFANSGLCLNWWWEVMPIDNNPGTLIFKVTRPNVVDQTPVETNLSQTPYVELWMPSMGHGSRPTQVEQVDQGTYRAKQVVFIMPGVWEIRFQNRNENQILDEATISYTHQ